MLRFVLPLHVLLFLASLAASHPTVVDMRINFGAEVDGDDVDASNDNGVDIAIDDGFGNDVGTDVDIEDDVDLATSLCRKAVARDEEDFLKGYRPIPKIAFSVYLSTVVKADCNNEVVKFDKEVLNLNARGKCYDKSTGMFTAPYTGVYQFTFVISPATTGLARAHLVRKMRTSKINVVDVVADGTKAGPSVQGTNTVILPLMKGYQVYVEMDGGSTLDGDRYTTFSGHLLFTC